MATFTRIYRGEIAHQGAAYPGQHDAIIDPQLWQAVQQRLEINRHERALAAGADQSSLLAGMIVDANGKRMTPTHATKRGKRYRYYVSASLLSSDRSETSRGLRIPAGDVEALVLDKLRAFVAVKRDVADALAPLELDAHGFEAALRNASELSERWLSAPQIKLASLAGSIVEQVAVDIDRIDIRLSRAKVAASLGVAGSARAQEIAPLILSVEAELRRAGKGKRLIIGDAAEVNVELVALIAEAFALRNELLSGPDDSIEAMTERLGMPKGRASALVRLSYLSPDIVRAIVEGRQPVELTPSRLLKPGKDLPHDWREQRRFLGFVRPSS